jgi:hypothetical protein
MTHHYFIKSFWLHFSVMLLVTVSCREKSHVDTKVISQEVKNREIKRVTQADLLQEASLAGSAVVKAIEQNWIYALDNGIENKGVEYSKKFCIVPFIPGYDTIAGEEIVIRKIGRGNKRGIMAADTTEQQLVAAYEYNVDHQLPLSPNVQVKDTYLLYTSPIVFNKKMCYQCHGARETGKEENNNNFAGIWSVKIARKKLVREMD